jgi:hypothetical protein
MEDDNSLYATASSLMAEFILAPIEYYGVNLKLVHDIPELFLTGLNEGLMCPVTWKCPHQPFLQLQLWCTPILLSDL